MRVNVDEQAISEPRIKRMAKRLARSHYEVLGRLMPVWMLCYQRRSAVVQPIDIDIAADLDGFAEAMVSEEMADIDEAGVYVRGVLNRIEFLEKQSQKGRKSGEVRRGRSGGSANGSTTARTDVKQVFKSGSNQTGTAVEHQLRNGRTTSRTYSPDLDLDQAPDQAPDQDHRILAGERENEGDEHEPAPDALVSPERADGADARASTAGGVKGPPARPYATSARNEPRLPDPPMPALTTAAVLMDYLLQNHPDSKLARATETQRETTLVKWAHDIRVMHEADRLEYGAIQAMIHWCQRDKFWSTVILSAGKLRDKWDAMAAQRKRPAGAAAKAQATEAEIAARRAKENAESRAEMERIRAKAAAVAAERAESAKAAGGDPDPAQQLDAEPDSAEDDLDAQ